MEMSGKFRLKQSTKSFSVLPSSQTLPTIALLLSVNVLYHSIRMDFIGPFYVKRHLIGQPQYIVNTENQTIKTKKVVCEMRIKNNVDQKHKSEMKDTFE